VKRLLQRAKSSAPLVTAASAVALMGLFPLVNTDIWWHLASGRWMVHNVQIPRCDPFSWGTTKTLWTDVHWLYQLTSFGLWKLGGALALVLAKVFTLFAASVVLLTAAWQLGDATVAEATPAEGERPHTPTALSAWRWGGAGALVVSMAAAQYLLLARPVIISLLLVALFLLLLERYFLDGRLRWLLLLLPLQTLWANVQAPLLVSCYALGALIGRYQGKGHHGASLDGRALRRLMLWPLALLLAALVNPYGVDVLLLALELFFRIDTQAGELFRFNVSENVPSWVLERAVQNPLWGFKFVAFAAFATFLLLPRRIPVARLLTLVAFFYLALTANRNVLLFCFVAGFTFAGQLAMLPRKGGRWRDTLLGRSGSPSAWCALVTRALWPNPRPFGCRRRPWRCWPSERVFLLLVGGVWGVSSTLCATGATCRGRYLHASRLSSMAASCSAAPLSMRSFCRLRMTHSASSRSHHVAKWPMRSCPPLTPTATSPWWWHSTSTQTGR